MSLQYNIKILKFYKVCIFMRILLQLLQCIFYKICFKSVITVDIKYPLCRTRKDKNFRKVQILYLCYNICFVIPEKTSKFYISELWIPSARVNSLGSSMICYTPTHTHYTRSGVSNATVYSLELFSCSPVMKHFLEITADYFPMS